MSFRNGRVIASLLRMRLAPLSTFSRLLPLRLLFACALALTASPLCAKTSLTLVEKVAQPWKIAVLQRAGGLENDALFSLDSKKMALPGSPPAQKPFTPDALARKVREVLEG